MTRHPSLTLRLTLLFALTSALVLVALGTFLKYAVERHFEQQDLQELTGKLELTRHALSQVHDQAGLDDLPQHLGDALVGHHGLSVTLVDDRGVVWFASAGAHHPPPPVEVLARTNAQGRIEPMVVRADGRVLRCIVAQAWAGIAGKPPFHAILALDIEHHMEFTRMFDRAIWASVGLGILLAGLLGWLAARRGLAPLRAMAELARGISASQLSQRLSTDSVPRELIEPVTAFNGMLSRLEDSFQRLSDFSSDLAHELRTPISNLMTQTQVALAQARSAEAYREVLYSNMEEYDRLARMIGDMLFLAKADHGLIVPRREAVDLAAEVAGLFEFYDALAEAQGVSLACTGQAAVAGDRLMLRRALSNLISNAIRHTPRMGTVSVRIEASGAGRVRIGISNPGAPIPPEHLPHLFERFYRVDASRQRGGEGAGLGLAITQSIVAAHRGTITVHSDAERTCFEIDLPHDAAEAEAEADTTAPNR